MSDQPIGSDIEILERRRAHDGFFKLDVLALRHRRFDGTMSAVLEREVLVQKSAAAVLPYDPTRDCVVLVEQFRPTAIDGAEGGWLIEAPAGLAEPDEQVEDLARRELLEETGLRSWHLERALAFRATPGCSTEHATVFIGLVDAPKTGSLHGLAHEDEDIRTHIIDRTAALTMVYDEKITSATAVTGLLYLELHHHRLQTIRCPSERQPDILK